VPPLEDPHSLVAELAERLVPAEKLKQAEDELREALGARQQDENRGDWVRRVRVDKTRALADALANDPAVPELYTFAGFLGGVLKDDTDTTKTMWRLLYLDSKLFTWLLVDHNSILLRKDVDDETSPAGTRDYVWMKADASVSRGEGPPQRNEIQARFLRGDFVSAGDFAASVTGGTYAPPTGPACPLTPGCCGKKTK